jgi:hypothetical protein
MPEGSILLSRFRRLIAMDGAEIADRLRQYSLARWDLLGFRIGRDFTKVPYATALPSDTHGRFFFAPTELPAICSLIKRELPVQAEEILSLSTRIRDHRFDLLGYENLDYGRTIDWHLDAVHGKRAPKMPWFKIRYLDFEQVGDAKITWELNRHQHFVTLAKAYLLTEDESFAAEVLSQFHHWWKENPYPIGINWASALEVAFRVQSWIWTFFILQSCPLFTTERRRQWVARLRLSGRHIENYLSTYFSPNTHLLGEALALFFLGTLFSFPSAERWREKGWQILLREAGKQVREDGFYFERSTYYHVYALDMFLHARILAKLNEISIPEEFESNLQRMLNALLLLSRAGISPTFGDDDGGRLFDGKRNRSVHMLDPLATGAVLYQRGDFKKVARVLPEETLWLLGVKAGADFERIASEDSCADSTALAASSSYLIFDAASRQQLLIDAGPSGGKNSGHGHADALSVSLIRDRRVLLRDSGTFEYVGPGRERSRLRGTGAHNTLRVDGRDQAEIIGPFSWANVPQVRVEHWINGKHFDSFEGSHSGYSRANSPIIHRRSVFHPRENLWLVRDVVEGDGEHEIEIAWHIGAGLARVPETESLFSDGEQVLAVLTNESNSWSRTIRDFACSPVYGKLVPASVIRLSTRQELPAEFVTVLVAGNEVKGNCGRIAKISNSAYSDPSAYRYLHDRRESTFVFAGANSSWKLGSWSSDAGFLYASIDHESHMCCLVLRNASCLDAGGNRLISCARPVKYAEVWSSMDTTEIFSSDPQAVSLLQPLRGLWPGMETVVTSSAVLKNHKSGGE